MAGISSAYAKRLSRLATADIRHYLEKAAPAFLKSKFMVAGTALPISERCSADHNHYFKRKVSADEPGASLRQSTSSLATPGQESGEAEHENIQRRRKAQRKSNWAKTGQKIILIYF